MAALDLDELAAGALGALGVGCDLAHRRDLPTNVGLLLFAEVGCVVVFLAHVALELWWQRNALKSSPCQSFEQGQIRQTYRSISSGL